MFSVRRRQSVIGRTKTLDSSSIGASRRYTGLGMPGGNIISLK